MGDVITNIQGVEKEYNNRLAGRDRPDVLVFVWDDIPSDVIFPPILKRGDASYILTILGRGPVLPRLQTYLSPDLYKMPLRR